MARSKSRSFGDAGAWLVAAAVTLIGWHPQAVEAAERWELEARLGGAWNVPLPIQLRQQGYDDLRFTAHWRTDAWRQPLYYGWRAVAWTADAGWALDLVHHKLYLEGPPAEVQSLGISHGYNLLTIQRVEERGGWRYGVSVGAVVAHPESEVRGRVFDEHGGLFRSGYFFSGPTAGAHIGGVRALGRRVLGTVEARLTLSYASVPIADGTARVPNIAVHATAGLGWIVSGSRAQERTR